MNFRLKLAFLFISICLFGYINSQLSPLSPQQPFGGAKLKLMNEQCNSNEECASKSCKGGRCSPLTCRSDDACLKAGLFDHYCRKRGLFGLPKLFASECVPKKGPRQSCSRDGQCVSNKCIPIIGRCT